MITLAQLVAIMPKAKNRAPRFLGYINETFHEFDIDTVARQASFLAQVAHESGQLVYLQEIASGAAYEGRKDLGNIYPGDGRQFRGHALIQITGRTNSQRCADYFGKPLDEWLAWAITPEGATRSSGWWWFANKANLVADTGDEVAVSRLVNCGSARSKCTPNGLKERLAFKETCMRVLS